MTDEEEMIALARRVPEEIATEGKVELVDEISTADPVEHSNPEDIRGREAIKERVREILGAFSDFTATVEDAFAEGDRVAMRVTLSGRHTGEFMGIEPTGRTFEVRNLVITRVEDGKIAERWTVGDDMGMMQQLGVIEPPTG